ncbi:MAG: hypothetical protein ACLFMX_01515 [Halobacteriales archaeon]
MSLDAFAEAVDERYRGLDDAVTVDLDEQTRTELAVLLAAFEPTSVGEVVRRAVHLLARDAIDRGQVDLQLRRRHDITYDEYLAGMTYDEMAGEVPTSEPDDRRYRF